MKVGSATEWKTWNKDLDFFIKSENTGKRLFNTKSYAKAHSTKIQNIIGWNITPDFRAGVQVFNYFSKRKTKSSIKEIQ